MAARSILHNAAFSLAGQMAARVLALVFYAVLARQVGPERYGLWGLGAAFGTLLVVLVEPGLNPVLVRDAARDGAMLAPRLAMTLGYKLAALTVAWPLSVGAAWALGQRGQALWAVALAGGAILLGGLEDMCGAALTALERLDLEGALRVASKVLGAGVGLAMLAAHARFEWVLAAVCAGAAATGVLGLAMLAAQGVTIRVRLPLEAVGRLLAESWPLAVHNVLWLVALRLDQVMATAMGVGHADLGDYNAAVKMVEGLIMFPTAVAVAFQASLSRAWAQSPQHAQKALHLALATSLGLCLPITVGGGMLADGLTQVVFGNQYSHAGALLSVQLLTLTLVGIQGLGMVALTAAGRTRVQARLTALNLAVNVLTNLALVPRWGMLGASAAAVAGHLAATAGVWAALRGLDLGQSAVTVAWRAVACCAALAGAVWLAAPLGTLPAVLAGGVTYAAVFLPLGGWQQLQALRAARRA